MVGEELITWVVQRAGAWVVEARRTAKSERQQRLVNAVHDAGLCLGAMRALDRQFSQLLIELRTLNPADLNAETRNRIKRDLFFFTEVDTVMPVVDQAESGLKVFARTAPEELAEDITLIAEVARRFGPTIYTWEGDLLPVARRLDSSFVSDAAGQIRDAAELLQQRIKRAKDGLRDADRAFGRLRAELMVAAPLVPPPAWAGELPETARPA
jgi:hypothetical protein